MQLQKLRDLFKEHQMPTNVREGSLNSKISGLGVIVFFTLSIFSFAAVSAEDEPKTSASVAGQSCEAIMSAGDAPAAASATSATASVEQKKPRARKAANTSVALKSAPAANGRSAAYSRILAERPQANNRVWSLNDFFAENPDENFAVAHPFTVANAAEKTYALLMHEPPRKALDPLYGVKPTWVYPMLAGHELAGGRMVVGNEEALAALVNFLGSAARGDRSGKAIGFPGPAGTGKTELMYVVDRIERSLPNVSPKYQQYSYRFQNLHTIPFLKNMFRFDRETGNPNYKWIDPDMPRSPFTLLRDDMKEAILAKVIPQIDKKWNLTITKGWSKPEPKSKAIIKAILEHRYPEIAEGLISENDLSAEEYLSAISEYLVIVPKLTVQNKTEAQIIRAQTEDPNFEALFARPNLLRQAFYSSGEYRDLAIDYTGQVFQQDGSLLMMDELYRNPPSFLNLLLEVKQNRMVQTDYSEPVEVDVVPVWNSNDESIEKAQGDQALKASLDRDEPHSMRLLLHPNQIEATALFQVEIKNFSQRNLEENTLKPLNYTEVYPAVDPTGKTQTAYRRYALYYQSNGENILVAPLTLNYMAWLAAASRFETSYEKMMKYKSELNLVQRDPSLFTNPITRLKIMIGQREVDTTVKQELYRIKHLLQEGQNGITARDIESWLKAAFQLAAESKKGVLTPRMLDQAFEQQFTSGTLKAPNGDTRARWQNLRVAIKDQILLPMLENDVRNIISGDGDRANRIYDLIEREFIELANNPNADKVVPDDGSQDLLIDQARLNKIRELYQKKFGREFSPTFLLRNLQGARRGQKPQRDSDLLEAVRDLLAEQDMLTGDFISLYNSYYNGESSDPTLSEKVALLEVGLSKYGYDQESFREALSYVHQLQLSFKERKSKAQNQ